KLLRMDRSNFSVNDSQQSEDFSKPYERRQGKVVEIPFRVTDAIGPAGSINSCTDDMVQWLRVNLGAGRLGDKEAIALDTIAHMHRLQMAFEEDVTFPES